MLEKKITFKDGERTIVYFSSVPDSYKAEDPNVIRALTIMGFHIVETLKDGRVKLTMVTQTDEKVKGAAMISYKAVGPMLVSKNIQEQHKMLLKFLRKGQPEEVLEEQVTTTVPESGRGGSA